MDNRKAWREDKTTKGGNLLREIAALADRARASGFTTTEYILKMAATELSKDLRGNIPGGSS